MSKLRNLILALAMAFFFTLSVPAFSADEEDGVEKQEKKTKKKKKKKDGDAAAKKKPEKIELAGKLSEGKKEGTYILTDADGNKHNVKPSKKIADAAKELLGKDVTVSGTKNPAAKKPIVIAKSIAAKE